MKPWKTFATEPASPGGKELVLQERDGVYVIRAGGQELMSSARHGSEEALAKAGLCGLRAEAPSLLIGGLGLGYTLRAALDRLPCSARVVVVEISAAVVAWNRGPLAQLAGEPLADRRVSVEVAEIGRFLAATQWRFDAILLDVDNGPSALSRAGNQALYGPLGIAAFSRALRPGGVLVVWSAREAPRFIQKLRKAGFDASEQWVAARPGGQARHVLIAARLARASGAEPASPRSAGRTRPPSARGRGWGPGTRLR
jgi:spermidine synthase